MSELKEIMLVNQVSGERTPSGYYRKAEVDKVIAEKDEEIVELKKQVHDYALGLYVMQAKAEKEARHNKYKRCLAKAEMCDARYDEEDAKVNGSGMSWEYISKEMKYWERWRNRWRELAEKFKEAK